MEKSQFLEQHLFSGLTKVNKSESTVEKFQFSEADFEIILERAVHFGIGIFTISTYFKGKAYASTSHEDHKKKATDFNWYKRAFETFKKGQAGLTYAATYKISPKLLSKDIFQDEEE